MTKRFATALTVALMGWGCGAAPVCAPGATQSCVCATAAQGAQSCAADGTRWEPCVCANGAAQPAAAPAPSSVAPAARPAPAAVADRRTPAAICPTIRDIDWKNRSYDFGSSGVSDTPTGEEQVLQLRNGLFRIPGEDEFDFGQEFRASDPVYGDLTGDGVEEAVILLDVQDGGNDPPRWLEAYTIRNCEPVRVGVVPASHPDDEYNSLFNQRVENGRIALERQDWSAGGAHCCPEHERTEYWRMQGGQLVEDRSARMLRRVLPETAE